MYTSKDEYRNENVGGETTKVFKRYEGDHLVE